MKKNKPILVTGSHRSGSTWVGQMLSLAPWLCYVSEPFNQGYGLKIFSQWFTYINEKNEAKYFKDITRLLSGYGHYRFTWPALRYWLCGLWPFEKRWLIKDPIACFSSQWLADNFEMEVVVLFRHPLAFYSSLKRLNWHFDFDNFLNQDNLISDHLYHFIDLIKKKDKSYAEEAAILWLCLYSVLDKYISRHPHWLVKRHEDLANNPLSEFKKLYNELGLDFSAKTEKEIIKYSAGKISSPLKDLDLKRNSRAVISQGFKNVSKEEMEIIKKITGDLALKYYPLNDWPQYD